MARVHQRFLGITEARTPQQYLAALLAYANDRGYGVADAIAFIDDPVKGSWRHAMVDNVPRHSDWLAIDPAVARRCPVQQHCRFRSDSVLWGSRTYAAPQVKDIYEVIAPLGLKSGICAAVRLPGHRLFQVSLHSDRDLNYAAPLPTQTADDLRLFIMHALVGARSVLLPYHPLDEVRDLTEIEKELLRLAGDDLSMADIADRANLSDADTARTLEIAVDSLGCSSAKEAALLATQLGII